MTYILRPATVSDAEAICGIYNPYVLNTTISFETAVVTPAEMAQRIRDITATFPWLGFEKVGAFRQVGRKFDTWIDVAYWQLLLQ